MECRSTLDYNAFQVQQSAGSSFDPSDIAKSGMSNDENRVFVGPFSFPKGDTFFSMIRVAWRVHRGFVLSVADSERSTAKPCRLNNNLAQCRSPFSVPGREIVFCLLCNLCGLPGPQKYTPPAYYWSAPTCAANLMRIMRALCGCPKPILLEGAPGLLFCFFSFFFFFPAMLRIRGKILLFPGSRFSFFRFLAQHHCKNRYFPKKKIEFLT